MMGWFRLGWGAAGSVEGRMVGVRGRLVSSGWVVSVVLAVVVSVPGYGSPGGEAGSVEDGGVHQPAVDLLGRRFPGLFDGTGCEGGLCAGEPLLRWEMAVWMVRVIDGVDPPAGAAPHTVTYGPALEWPSKESPTASLRNINARQLDRPGRGPAMTWQGSSWEQSQHESDTGESLESFLGELADKLGEIGLDDWRDRLSAHIRRLEERTG